jgi:fructose-specific phosphotransferase system IIA component
MTQTITIRNLIKEKYVRLDLNQTNKKKLMLELVEVLAQSGKLKDKKSFFNALWKREKLGSTGIGNGVAIPHARSLEVKDFVLAFGRHAQGVDFGALDGEKTHLFFVLASPEHEVGAHLKILAEISRLVKDKFIVENLKKAKDKKELMKTVALYVQ